MSGKMFDWIMAQVDLSSELSPGKSLVEIVDDCRILVENHYGVRSYDTNSIRIKASFGEICVRGCDLKLACMSKQQLLITGCLEQISLFRGN